MGDNIEPISSHEARKSHQQYKFGLTDDHQDHIKDVSGTNHLKDKLELEATHSKGLSDGELGGYCAFWLMYQVLASSMDNLQNSQQLYGASVKLLESQRDNQIKARNAENYPPPPTGNPGSPPGGTNATGTYHHSTPGSWITVAGHAIWHPGRKWTTRHIRPSWQKWHSKFQAYQGALAGWNSQCKNVDNLKNEIANEIQQTRGKINEALGQSSASMQVYSNLVDAISQALQQEHSLLKTLGRPINKNSGNKASN